MIVLKILLYLLLSLFFILIAISLLRVNIIISYSEGLSAHLRILLFKFSLYPQKEKKKRKKGSKKKKTAKSTESKQQAKDTKKKTDVLTTVLQIYELLRELLNSFFGYLRINVCSLNIVAGGKDAAEAAINYGKLLAATNALAALFENTKNVKISEKELECSVDYSSEKTEAKIKIVLSIFVFQLIICLIRTGMIYIKNTLAKSSD